MNHIDSASGISSAQVVFSRNRYLRGCRLGQEHPEMYWARCQTRQWDVSGWDRLPSRWQWCWTGLPGKVGDDGEQRSSAEGWGTDCTSNCYHLRPFLSPAMPAVPARLTTARGAPTPPGDWSISLFWPLLRSLSPAVRRHPPVLSCSFPEAGATFPPTWAACCTQRFPFSPLPKFNFFPCFC